MSRILRVRYDQPGSGIVEAYATVEVEYTYVTGDVDYTFTVDQIHLVNLDRNAAHSFTYTIRLGSTVLTSGTFSNIAKGAEAYKSIHMTGKVTRTHADQDGISVTGARSGSSTTVVILNPGTTVPARASYQVTYNAASGLTAVGSIGNTEANYGTGAPSAQTKWHAESLTLSSVKPTCTNHAFKCWNTRMDGSGTSYNAGGSYTGNARLVLYALWNSIIKFNANGGSDAPSSQTKTFGTSLMLSTTRPTRAGYVFHGWGYHATEKRTWGSGKYFYSPGESYATEAATTLYAIWDPIIAYDANGGNGAPSAQTKVRWETLTLRTATPTRSGYVFNGWNTKANGSGTSYQPGGTMSATDNDHVTLYAQWLREPAPPAISSLTVVRWSGHTSSATGTQDDNGTQCRVVCKWSVDTTSDTVPSNVGTIATPTVTPSSGVTVGSWSHSTSGGVTTSTCYLSGVDIDTQYTVTVTVTDQKPQSTTRTEILTRAEFVMDFRNGGKAIGIGCAAPQRGLEVGWDVQLDGKLGVAGNTTVGGSLAVTGDLSAPQLTRVRTTSDIATAQTGWTITSQQADTYGKLMQVYLRLRPSAAVSAGTNGVIAMMKSGYIPASLHGFANTQGIGYVNGSGAVNFRTLVDLTTSTDVYVGLCFLKS